MIVLLAAFFIYRLVFGEYAFVPFAAIYLYITGTFLFGINKSLMVLRHD